jgi:glycosylphosphatidylinositol transamidase (GPIT) subunit GPI8
VQVLLGNRSAETPVVIESTNSSDVFVYIASHGSPGATVFSGNERQPVTTRQFTDMMSRMEREGRYRQIVFFVDTCFGESIARNATAQGMLYFTAASAQEPSMAAVYDMDIRQWLSDEFTAATLNAIREHPDITFRELYITVYEQVTGSHVRMVNAENFGDLDIPVREFLKP